MGFDMRKMNEKQRKELEMLVYEIMVGATSSDYARYILEHTKKRRTFMDDVIDDILCASAWEDEGYYSDDDIRLAVGRIFLERLGIEV